MPVSAASRPLLVSSGSRTHQGLLEGVGGQDTEDDRHAGRQLHLLDPRGALPRHEVVVAGVAPDDRAEAQHGVHLAGVRRRRGPPAGSSKAPGAQATVTSRRSVPASASASSAPSSSRSGDAAVELRRRRCRCAARCRRPPRRLAPTRAATSSRAPSGRATRSDPAIRRGGAARQGVVTGRRRARAAGGPSRSRLVRR